VNARADAGLAAVLLVALAGGLLLGGPGASPGQALSVLVGQGDADATAAVLGVRLPRLVLALAVGAALALAGAALQSLLANPLADPFLLGISGGGAAAATLAFAALPAAAIGLVPAAAMLGAAASTGLVWWMARGPLGPSPTRMLLAGVAVNAATSAVILAILALAPSPRLAGALAITMGSFAAAILPKSRGSSTTGVKKSTDWTNANSSESLSTPASSKVPVPTSSRSSHTSGSPSSTACRSAGPSLEAQPAQVTRWVSLMSSWRVIRGV